MSKAVSPLDTPMMRQYRETRALNPQALLLMRCGDFYEAYLEDAEQLSRVCGIALTARAKDTDTPIAMAGFPHPALDNHLPKLLAAGVRVAVMDQLEDPKQAAKEGRSIVRRGLTRVITAGTLIDEDALRSGSANHLVAITAVAGAIGIAALDLSTGRFTVEDAASAAQLALALARLQPAELVVPEELREDARAVATLTSACEPMPLPPLSTAPAHAWRGADARRFLGEHLRVSSLDGFGIGPGDDHLAAAAAAALRYCLGAIAPGGDGATGRCLAHVRSIARVHAAEHLVIDAVCRRNLELCANQRDGGRAGTLLAAIDRTCTAPGARLTADWLNRPLARIAGINARHDAVAFLVGADALRADLRDALGGVYDLERLLARLATGRAGARDLVWLAGSLRAAARVHAALLSAEAGAALPALIEAARVDLVGDPELVEDIEATLVADPPLAIGEGGLVRDGVDGELDELRAIKRDAGEWLAAYQVREAAACGLAKLKVGYNRVFGYYIEVSRANGEKVPAHFVRKQTLVGAERYITPELKEYEDRALNAEDRIRAKELAIFTALRDRASTSLPALARAGDALALIDVVQGLAETARRGGWTRPEVDDSLALTLVDCRHPVVEEVVGRGRFVANDTRLDASTLEASPRLAVITGPNMAGKSTYIRQVALAVVLAQAGAFVPAAQARVGVVDRVFTRVGAGDELARNLSTFMVEMAETASILNHATRRSLVVLDEVGRGTSTFDGVSLAWAITEHLHDRIGCRTLFATHYHELTDLAEDRAGIRNLTVAVAEQDEEVVFLHRIVDGAATKSYGIHVARLAGVPRVVIARAREVLSTLEQLNVGLTERERPAARAGAESAVQLTLFQAAESASLTRLKSLDLDDVTPRQALDLLAALQKQARSE
ncbi:MAG TPA: DNA mismatch repair protein MutS [Planctomycetota bacterium]|nr:DNA mismatch repair protein MutS [Planctomycetota bacterium]